MVNSQSETNGAWPMVRSVQSVARSTISERSIEAQEVEWSTM